MTGKPSWRFLRPSVLVGFPLVAAGAAVILTQEPETPPSVARNPPAAPAPTSAPAAPPPHPAEVTIRLAAPPPPTAIPMPSRPALPLPLPPPQPAAVEMPTNTAEWMALPIDDLRGMAHGGNVRAMEELARRLVSGIGVPQDAQSGAGWLLRAAEAGSPGAAFNVGVMYERGFVVERDSQRAVEWYRKAADGNVAVAKHNLALLLREGKGAPRDGRKAIELLRSAAHQGMSASMFSLGDIYERGDAAPKDAPKALAWFAVTVEFERQARQGSETPLSKTAQQRLETLQRVLTPAELERAEIIGQREYRQILATLTPPKNDSLPPTQGAPSSGPSVLHPGPARAPPQAPPPPPVDEAASWPNAPTDQIRAVQQSLIDLHHLKGEADGIVGPATRAAIREFEKSAGLPESGEVSRDIYVTLLRMRARRDIVTHSPLPPPPRVEAPPPRTAAAAPPPDPPKPPEPPRSIEFGKTEPPPSPPSSADIAKAAVTLVPSAEPPKPPAPQPRIELGETDPPLPPPTPADLAQAMPMTEPPKPDADAWPAKAPDQIRAIQILLGELRLMSDAPNGEIGPITLAAIRDYQRIAGLKQTGEPSKELFESLKEMRALMRPAPAGKPN